METTEHFDRHCRLEESVMVWTPISSRMDVPAISTCWEHMHCEREDKCSAYPEYGRACFAVTGTLCRGEDLGSYREKINRCRTCSFYGELMGDAK
jgi:hypothetical protein